MIVLLSVRVLSKVLYAIFYPFLFYVRQIERKSVPPSEDELLFISAVKLSSLIRQRKISCKDVITSYIRRIKEVEPFLNAVVDERFDDALKDAEAVDEFLKTTELSEEELERTKPLLGIPVTIKESCQLNGCSFTVGVVYRKGIKAENDCEAVARLRSSGAIPLLVSSTSELCLGLYCQNNLKGRTNNPYDITRNSGASSGGEGALLGAGASLIGLGTDIGGSIRYPAMCCGVFGHKSSPRSVPITGTLPLPDGEVVHKILSVGPLTRYAEDLRLALSVLTGDKREELGLQNKVDLKGITICYMEELPKTLIQAGADREFKDAIRKSATHLRDCFEANVIRDHGLDRGFRTAYLFSLAGLCESEPPALLIEGKHKFSREMLKCMVGKSEFTFASLFTYSLVPFKPLLVKEQYRKTRENLEEQINTVLSDRGVLLLPTFPTVALKHAEVIFKMEYVAYTMSINVLGLPSTQVPCGLNKDGLPIGIQVIAAPNQDRLCLAVAEELEKLFGGWIPPKNLR